MRKAGFTLIECIFSCLILSFVILFVLNLYPSSFVAIKRGESQVVADGFAQTILEDLRARAYQNVTIGSPPFYSHWIYGGIDYAPNITVDWVPARNGLPAADQLYLKRAMVTISWKFQDHSMQVHHEGYLHNVTR